MFSVVSVCCQHAIGDVRVAVEGDVYVTREQTDALKGTLDAATLKSFSQFKDRTPFMEVGLFPLLPSLCVSLSFFFLCVSLAR